MHRLALAALVVVASTACTVPENSSPARLAVWRDDGGLRAGLVSTEDAGLPAGGRDAAADLLVRSAPHRNRDVGLCSLDHWCWENPLPQGNALHGVWATAEGEVFAVGNAGTLLRFDGQAWSRTPWSDVPLTAVWGADREHVFAVGPTALLRFDGRAWTKDVPLEGAPQVLWGTSATDVWAAGTRLSHFDGRTWATWPADGEKRVVAMAGLSSKDVWAVARNEGQAKGQGLLLRYDGRAWTTTPLPFAFTAASLLVVAPNDAWLATDQGVVARFDGKSWKKATEVGGAGERPVLLALAKGGVLVAGPRRPVAKFTGGAWQVANKSSWALRSIWPLSSTATAWGVGDGGLVARWTGADWERAVPSVDADLRAIHGSGLANLWAVGEQGVVLRRSEQGEWSRMPSPDAKVRLNGVWVAGADDAWVAGEGELLHWDGRELTSRYEAAMGPLKSVAGRRSDDVYAAGDSGLFHFNGSVWLRSDTPATYPLDSVSVTADGNVWALGSGGMIRFDGKEWTEVGASKENAPTVLFGGLFGPYVAGAKGVWRYDGKAWAGVLSRGETLAGFASGSDDVWALGRGDEARWWNGVGWRRMAVACGSQLRAAWSQHGEVVVVGDGGAILHYRP